MASPRAQSRPEGGASPRRELRRTVLETRRLIAGLALRVADDQKAVQNLAELLTLHSDIRRFRIAVGPAARAGGRWVLCTGSPGLKDFLWRELRGQRPARP